MKKIYLTICAYFALLFYGMGIMIIGPLISHIKEEYSIGYGDAGFLMTALSVGFILTVLVSGYMVNRFSLKAMIISGLSAYIAGLTLFVFSSSFTIAIAAYSILGLGGGFIQVSLNTLVSELNPLKRSSALNLLHLFFGIGAFTGPIFSGALVHYGVRFTIPYGVIAIALSVIVVLMAAAEFPQSKQSETTLLGDLKQVLLNRYMIILSLAMVLYVGIEMGISTWAVLYMEEEFNMVHVNASLMVSYFWLAMTLGRIVCVFLAKWIKADLLFALFALGSFVSFLLYFNTESAVLAGVFIASIGFFFSGIFPFLMGLGGDRFPDSVGTVTSILLSCLGIGLMLFPWLMGIVRDYYSARSAMGALHGAFILLMTTAVILILFRYKEDN